MIDFSRFSTDQLVYAISVTSLAIWLLLLIVQKVIMTKAAPAAAPAANAAAGTALSRPAAPMPGEMTKALSAQDREFLPAALELLETPPSPVRIAGIWLISATFAAALLWAYFGKLDIHAIAQGRIQPSGRSKVIQPLEPGKVVAVLVENGSRVKAGDVLLELDPTSRVPTARSRPAISKPPAPNPPAAKWQSKLQSTKTAPCCPRRSRSTRRSASRFATGKFPSLPATLASSAPAAPISWPNSRKRSRPRKS